MRRQAHAIIPSGMTSMPNPCKGRLAIKDNKPWGHGAEQRARGKNGQQDDAHPAIAELSPSLPIIGVERAEVRSVMVINRVVSSGAASSCGSAPRMGIGMVCMNEAPEPAKARIATIRLDSDRL